MIIFCKGPTEHEGRAERRVAGERKLGGRREDPNPHIGVLANAAGSTNTVSEKAISFASACIVSGSRLARVGEHGKLVPCSGLSVKTSATT